MIVGNEIYILYYYNIISSLIYVRNSILLDWINYFKFLALINWILLTSIEVSNSVLFSLVRLRIQSS